MKNENNLMSSKSKLVSVIVPTYNRCEFIIDTLKSICLQLYRPIEIIVVDDGSSDDTEKVVKAFFQQYEYNGIVYHYIKTKNMGPSHARNVGINISKGDYIQFLDSDDILSKEKINRQVKLLNERDQMTACYGPWRYFCTNSNIVVFEKMVHKYIDPIEEWLNGVFVPLHSILWKNCDIMKIGNWDEELFNNEDGEYVMRFLLNGGRLTFCDDSFVYYRKDPNSWYNKTQISGIHDKAMIEARIKAIETIRDEARKNGKENKIASGLANAYYYLSKEAAGISKITFEACYEEFIKYKQLDMHQNCTNRSLIFKSFGFYISSMIKSKLKYVIKPKIVKVDYCLPTLDDLLNL